MPVRRLPISIVSMLFISLERRARAQLARSLAPYFVMRGRIGRSVSCSLLSATSISTGQSGLYTSPHLVAVRERIRINGVPLSEQAFARYFFEVWDRLESNDTVSRGQSIVFMPLFIIMPEEEPRYTSEAHVLPTHDFSSISCFSLTKCTPLSCTFQMRG